MDENGERRPGARPAERTGGTQAPARSGIRPAGAVRRPGAVQGWALRIRDWFGFVHRRRPDERFAIVPGAALSLAVLAGLAAITAALVVFVDPRYLAHVRDAAFQPSSVFETITWFGKSDWVLYPTGTALIVFSLFRADGMVRKSRHLAHTLLLAVYYVFTTVAFSGLLTMAFKNLIGRARPAHVEIGSVWQSMPFRDSYAFASFPSGHATTAGALALALALLFPRLKLVFVILGVAIAVSRPALGIHFPSDVFAGFCLGGAFSYLYARGFARKRLLFAFDDGGRVVPRFRLPWHPEAGG